MHVKNAITTFPKTERVNQKSVQLEIHTLLTLTENIANRITVQAVHTRGGIKMIKIIYQNNNEVKDITGEVVLGAVAGIAGVVAVGYLCHKLGVTQGYDKGFADGFFDATGVIHDSIVDTTETVKLKGTGKIVDLDGYLDVTGDLIKSKLSKQ